MSCIKYKELSVNSDNANNSNSKRIRVLDPNCVDLGDGVGVDGYNVNHEDLTIFVDLVAKTKPRTLLNNGEVETSGGVSFSFLSPFRNGTNNDKTTESKPFLTTDWTEIGGLFNESNLGNDYESFGITSIDIKINASQIPQVVINFVDVRGATLFEQGSCSKYAVFFHLPYPIFELTVKGYYGQPVKWYLNLTKFNTKFNSETGNFESTAEFIGWSYAFLADMLMGYGMAAPYMEGDFGAKEKLKEIYSNINEYYKSLYGGEDSPGYQEFLNEVSTTERSSDNKGAIFCGGQLGCITIVKILQRLKKLKEQLGLVGKSIDLKEYKQYDIVISVLQELKNEINSNYKTFLSKLEKVNNIDSSITFTPIELKDVEIKGLLNDVWSNTGTTKSYSDQIDDELSNIGKSGINIYETFTKTHGFQKNVIDGFTNDTSISPDLTIIFKKPISIIDENINTFKEERNNVKKGISEYINEVTVEILGFKPTIRNVFIILSANVELFNKLLIETTSSAEQYHDDYSKSNNKQKLWPWPTYTQDGVDDKGNIISGQEKYPGEDNSNPDTYYWPEVKFVDEFVMALIRVKKQIDLLSDDQTGNPGFDNYVPINPLETPLYDPSTPIRYKSLDEFESVSEIKKHVIERGFLNLDYTFINPLYLTKSTTNYTKQFILTKELAEKQGEIDAFNLLNTIENDTTLRALSNFDITDLSNIKSVKHTDIKINDVIKLDNHQGDYYVYTPTDGIKIGSDIGVSKNIYGNINNIANNDPELLVKIIDQDEYDNQSRSIQLKTEESKIAKAFENSLIDYKKDIIEKFKNAGKNLEILVDGGDGTLDSKNNTIFYDKPRLFISLNPSDKPDTEEDNNQPTIWSLDNIKSSDLLYVNYIENKGEPQEFNIIKDPYFNKAVPTTFFGDNKETIIKNFNDLKNDDIKEDDYDDFLDEYDNLTTSTTFVQLPLWLWNVNSVRSILNNNFPSSGFTSITTEKENLAYLLLNTLMPTPLFLTNTDSNYDFLKSILPFQQSGSIIKIPKGWVYYLGGVFWRQQYYKNNNIDPIQQPKYQNIIGGGDSNLVYKEGPVYFDYYSFFSTANTNNNKFYSTSEGKLSLTSHNNEYQLYLPKGNYVYNIKHTTPSNWGFYQPPGDDIWDLIFVSVYDNKLRHFSLPTYDIEKPNEGGYENGVYYKLYTDFSVYNSSNSTIQKQKSNYFHNVMESIPDGVKQIFIDKFVQYANSDDFSVLLQNIDPVNFNNKPLSSSYELIKINTADSDDNDYQLVVKESVGNSIIEQLLKDNFVIVNSTPKTWWGINYNDIAEEYRNSFSIKKEFLDEYIKSFNTTYNKYKNERISELSKQKNKSLNNIGDNLFGDSDIKLSLYRSFSSLNNKWISSSRNGKLFFNISDDDCIKTKPDLDKNNLPLISHFSFVDRTMADIGNKSVIDVETLSQMIENPTMSFYQLIDSLMGDNYYNFFPLPSYSNLTNMVTSPNVDATNSLHNMFDPITKWDCVPGGPHFICMYAGGNSQVLDFGTKANCGIDQKDLDKLRGSFKITDEDGSNFNSDIPNDIKESNTTVFRVAYGHENQSHFKGIQLDQSEFKETNESLKIIDTLGQNGDPSKSTTKSQNLHNLYLTRAYTCTVESMGNMQIQPMMYFQLDNVPMFNGTYMILDVSHSITPNKAMTTFKGTRQPITTVPLVTDPVVAMNIDLGDLMSGVGDNEIGTGGRLANKSGKNGLKYGCYCDFELTESDTGIIFKTDARDKFMMKENGIFIQKIGNEWFKQSKYLTRRIVITSAGGWGGRKNSKDTGHGADSRHYYGAGIDIRAIANNNTNDSVLCNGGNYSREGTRELIKLIRSLEKNDKTISIKGVFWNDPVLIQEGLCTEVPGHCDHIHIEFNIPKRIEDEINSGKVCPETLTSNCITPDGCPCVSENKKFSQQSGFKSTIEKIINGTYTPTNTSRDWKGSFEGLKQVSDLWSNNSLTKKGIIAMSYGLSEGFGSSPENKNPGNIREGNSYKKYNTWTEGWTAFSKRYLGEWLVGNVPAAGSWKYPNCYITESNKIYSDSGIKYKVLTSYEYVKNNKPTLRQHINIYAPWGDNNNPSNYIAGVAATLKSFGYDINIDDPMESWV